MARQVVPYTVLDAYEAGGDVLAIAHNGNLSNGIMFRMIEPGTGEPIDREYAEIRAKWKRRRHGLRADRLGLRRSWAEENTREAHFAAMKRRETYATTGPRMAVRLFAGWEFTAEDANTRSPAVTGYAKGVPIGGDLTTAAGGKAPPPFLVAALKDPIGANLDRYQIVKGWLDEADEIHERSMTSPGRASARPAQTVRCQRLRRRSTSLMRHGPIP